MWFLIFSLLAAVVAGKQSYGSVGYGYFWHITDIHFDANLNQKGCRREYERNGGSHSLSQRRPAGRYGDYGCDSPWELVVSAVQAMMSRQDVEFLLWTGDAMSHEARERREERIQQLMLKNLTELLLTSFKSQFVFPALGHDDPHSRRNMSSMFSRWLPPDSVKTFEKGGYYLMERKSQMLQIVVLNTNLMRGEHNNERAEEQWLWLDDVLLKRRNNGETVYLVGHIPPGSGERVRGSVPPGHMSLTDYHNKRYISTVRKYADIIVGQFFGHLHTDTFRVMYDSHGRPASWVMIAPAVTPRRTNNPGLRLYKFDKGTGQILDYTQYYLNLSTANSNLKGEAEWFMEYNFSSYYGISNITPLSLHNLAEKFTHSIPTENPVFLRYYRANFVRNNPHLGSCDSSCAHTHYCAITKVDYKEFEHCLKTAASALSSSSTSFAGARWLAILFSSVVIGFV